MMKPTICTLFEDHYHYGVAGLVNSLAASGYEGVVWVGHRGALPSWIVDRHDFDPSNRCFQVTPSLLLRTVELDPPVSLNYHKATFMLDILRKFDPSAEAVCYMDPDMVVKCRWKTIEQWLLPRGIALVEDADWSLPSTHRKRIAWQEFFSSHGIAPVRGIDRFYNAGFVGISRNEIDFLFSWERACGLVAAHNGGSLRQRRVGKADHLFHSADEDALNFILSTTSIHLNTLGPEAMDFTPGGQFFSHAVGSVKPWEGHHVRRALSGNPPTSASQWFYCFAAGPLLPFSPLKLMKRRMAMKIASVLGRWKIGKRTKFATLR